MSLNSHKTFGAKVELHNAFTVQDLPTSFRQPYLGLLRALEADPSVSEKSRPHSLPKLLGLWLDPCIQWLCETSAIPAPDFGLLFSELVVRNPDGAEEILRVWQRCMPRTLEVCCDALLEVLPIIRALAPGVKEKHVISPTHLARMGYAHQIGGNPVYTKRGARKVEAKEAKSHQYSYIRHVDSRYCRFCGCLTEMEYRKLELIAKDKTPAIDKTLLINGAPLIEEGLSNSHCGSHKSRTPGYDRGRRLYPYIAALSYLARMQTGVFLIPPETDKRPIVAEIVKRLGVKHQLIRNLPQLCQVLDLQDYRGNGTKLVKRLNREFRKILEEMIVPNGFNRAEAALEIKCNSALGANERGARIRKPSKSRMRVFLSEPDSS